MSYNEFKVSRVKLYKLYSTIRPMISTFLPVKTSIYTPVVYDNICQPLNWCMCDKMCKQILLCELSLIVCLTSVSSHKWKAFCGLDSQAFPAISLKWRSILKALVILPFKVQRSMALIDPIEITCSPSFSFIPQLVRAVNIFFHAYLSATALVIRLYKFKLCLIIS